MPRRSAITAIPRLTLSPIDLEISDRPAGAERAGAHGIGEDLDLEIGGVQQDLGVEGLGRAKDSWG